MADSDYRSALTTYGYILVNNRLSTDLLCKLRSRRNLVLAALPKNHRDEYKSQGSLVNLGDHPEFSHLIASAEIAALLQALDFSDIRWLGGYLISKPANSPALFWHQDWWGWDNPLSYSEQMPGIGVMIYLSDTREENGCLRVIPGSHRCRHTLHALPVAHEQSLSHIEDADDIAYKPDEFQAAVEVNTGDVVLIDPRLLHSTFPNQTNEERSLLTLWYLPDFHSLPEAIKARYVQIFNRNELDTGDTASGKLLDGWPPKDREIVRHLEPHCDENVEPHPWNRTPDQSRMIASTEALAPNWETTRHSQQPLLHRFKASSCKSSNR